MGANTPVDLDLWFANCKSQQNKWLWGFVGFFLSLVVCMALVPPNVIEESSFRPLGDAMMLTHIMAIFPLVVSVYHEMEITPWFFSLSVIASLLYHGAKEEIFFFGIMDSTMANSSVIIAAFMFYVNSLNPNSNPALQIATLITVIMALGCFFLPHSRPQDMCYRTRIHSLWHMLAYSAFGLVLLNYKRGFVSAPGKAPTFVRKLQMSRW